MANTYFQFKQFTIHQDQCAMKVCTDACILGAWFAAKVSDYSTILDIGSGTGLLMMMLAQQTRSEIHGIEIDLPSFKQLKENINQNKWRERLKVFPGDARTYVFPTLYDFIIANPPFFENDLASQNEAEQVAKHSKSLTLDNLAATAVQALQPHGSLGVLLPHARLNEFDAICEKYQLYPLEKLLVKQTPAHDHFRAVVHYARHPEPFVAESELIISDEHNRYTPEFVELMKDYYLYL